MAEWYSNWRKKNFRDDDHLDERFSSYWGLGPSFSCEIDNMCKVPRCSDLNRPEQAQDYENAAMFLASMANFNNVCSTLYLPCQVFCFRWTKKLLALWPDLRCIGRRED